jgi:hypothetical protein
LGLAPCTRPMSAKHHRFLEGTHVFSGRHGLVGDAYTRLLAY